MFITPIYISDEEIDIRTQPIERFLFVSARLELIFPSYLNHWVYIIRLPDDYIALLIITSYCDKIIKFGSLLVTIRNDY